MPLACFAVPGSWEKYKNFQWKFLTCHRCGNRGLCGHFPEYSQYKLMCLHCRTDRQEKHRARTDSGSFVKIY